MVVALVGPRHGGGQDDAEDRGGQDEELAPPRKQRAPGGGDEKQEAAEGHSRPAARQGGERLGQDAVHADAVAARLGRGRRNDERSDQQIVDAALRERDQDLVAARLAQQRRRHLVGGGLLLQLRLERLAVDARLRSSPW